MFARRIDKGPMVRAMNRTYGRASASVIGKGPFQRLT